MNVEISDRALGVLIVIVLIPVGYVGGRFLGWIADVWHAFRLAPFAPAIGGKISWNQGCITGSYQGRDVRVYFGQQNVGSGRSAIRINAFHIEVVDLPGRQDWRIIFEREGFFTLRRKLYIEVQDKALGERLDRCGVIAAVSTVSAHTWSYVTVQYEARWQLLTYTDDVSPRRLPSRKHFAAQLELVARLAEVNEEVNPGSHPHVLNMLDEEQR